MHHDPERRITGKENGEKHVACKKTTRLKNFIGQERTKHYEHRNHARKLKLTFLARLFPLLFCLTLSLSSDSAAVIGAKVHGKRIKPRTLDKKYMVECNISNCRYNKSRLTHTNSVRFCSHHYLYALLHNNNVSFTGCLCVENRNPRI